MTLEHRVRFGSADSVDIDVAYVVDRLPPLAECKQRARDNNPHGESRNFIVVEDGFVRDCFKGTPDEMNNALLRTYGLHEQTAPNPVRAPVTRIVPLKLVRATRIILSLLSRGPDRAAIKAALRSLDQAERIRTLASLSLADTATSVEVRKSIAFQLAQVLGLLDGRELYTKADIAAASPALAPFVYRRDVDDARALDDARDRVVAAVDEVYVRTRGSLNLFCYKNSVTVTDWNPFCAQSRGAVIDLAAERCVCFPYEKFFKLGELDGWRRQDLPQAEPDEIVEKVDGSFVSGFVHDGEIIYACKGNFDVAQARRAAELAQRYDMSALDFDRYYFTFEVVYPGNRFPTGFASVDYGESALFLTGVRDRLSHAMLPYADVARMARRAGLRYPARLDAPFADVLARLDDDRWQNHEGWVANFGGKRVKLKLSSYLRVNDILNGLKHGNSRVLKKFLRVSDAEWRDYIAILPEEFTPAVTAEIAFYERKRDELLAQVDALIAERCDRSDPRAFIEFVMTRVAPDFRKIAFRRMRGQGCEPQLRALLFRKLFDGGRKREVVDWRLLGQ